MEWLIVVAAIAIGVPAAFWLAQDRLIFFPQSVGGTSHLPPHAAPFTVTASDGTQLRGWFVAGLAAPAPTVIYFGGNAEEVSFTLADPRWPRDWSIVALNYRGYGASEGTPGEREFTSDALSIYDAVAARDGIDRKRIVVFGRSLGTALAAHVAGERSVAGVVLVSPYDSLVAVGKHHYPWLPVSLLLRAPFRCDQRRRPQRDAVARNRRRFGLDHFDRTIPRTIRRVGRTQELASCAAQRSHYSRRHRGLLVRRHGLSGAILTDSPPARLATNRERPLPAGSNCPHYPIGASSRQPNSRAKSIETRACTAPC